VLVYHDSHETNVEPTLLNDFVETATGDLFSFTSLSNAILLYD
jgi:hypothetical protein